ADGARAARAAPPRVALGLVRAATRDADTDQPWQRERAPLDAGPGRCREQRGQATDRRSRVASQSAAWRRAAPLHSRIRLPGAREGVRAPSSPTSNVHPTTPVRATDGDGGTQAETEA